MTQIVDAYSRWLSTSNVPKLFINAAPGTILTGAQREFCRAWANQREVTVRGYHFIQRPRPPRLGGRSPIEGARRGTHETGKRARTKL